MSQLTYEQRIERLRKMVGGRTDPNEMAELVEDACAAEDAELDALNAELDQMAKEMAEEREAARERPRFRVR